MDRRRFLAALGAGSLAGCGAPAGSGTGRRDSEGSITEVDAEPGVRGYTHHRPDGNRYARGQGSLTDREPVDVPLERAPAWLVGVPLLSGSLWVAVDAEGWARAVRVRGRDVRRVAVEPARLPAGTPPLLTVDAGTPTLLAPPEDGSALTHPVPIDGGRAYVAGGGDVVIERGDRTRLAVDAPPDARLVRAGGRIVVLAGATTRYGHGALGDEIEAGGIAVIAGGRVEARIDLPGEAVVEGIAPILADLGEDLAAVVTETDATAGAREVAYRLGGERIASGPAIGAGFRWRHQLAVAPFGPGGGRELAVVRTPHVGGEVEFYRPDLGIAATRSGYSSHAFGSRTLDGGLAGDFDGDGRVELLVPTTARRALAGVRHTVDGAAEAWRVPAGGDLTSNLAAVEAGEGLAVGVGTSEGLRLWPG